VATPLARCLGANVRALAHNVATLRGHAPRFVPYDNGPELVSAALQDLVLY